MISSREAGPRLDILVSPAEFDAPVPGRGIVVIDVLRATTVIARALAAGASRIAPMGSVEAAFERRRELGGDALLCGERDGHRVEGFDLGNSPLEYGPDIVGGRTLILASTNGTVMLARNSSARRVLTATFNNAAAIARALVEDGGDWTIVPSGKLGRACLEDLLCAGRLVALSGAGSANSVPPDDGVMLALGLHERFGSNVPAALLNSAHGRYLAEVGFAGDLEACAAIDTLDVVPELREGWITAAGVENEAGTG